jgi:hypothetical protein
MPKGSTTVHLLTVVAGAHSLALIHYDADLDIAAEIVTTDHRWIGARGIGNAVLAIADMRAASVGTSTILGSRRRSEPPR